MRNWNWFVVLGTATICSCSIARAEAPTAHAGTRVGQGSLPAPTQTLTLESHATEPQVRTTPPTSIRLPLGEGATKPGINALKARQDVRTSALQQAPEDSKPKPAISGPRYVAPAVKAGPITGDNVTDPFFLGPLPTTEFGTTDGYNDDYNGNCGINGGAPDVVYEYYADNDQFITVDLCYSSFDTRLYITYVGDETVFQACSDDVCGENGLRSRIESFYLGAGEQIWIFIDGFDGNFGDYELSVFTIGDYDYDPIIIPSIPYDIMHTTTGYSDDYDEDCDFTSTSADVVFRYTPTYDQDVTIDLCGSTYDTKVFVYENVVVSGAPYACNEDGVGCPEFQSRIECLQFYADSTYFIVVDGWGGQDGEFYLDMFECLSPCWTGCVPEATPDQEVCPNGSVDEVNGGCLTGGYFQPLQPNEIVCGSAYFTGSEYDTDWYSRYLFEGDSVTWCVAANFPVFAFIVDLTIGCGSEVYVESDFRFGCDTMYLGHRIETEGMYAFVVQNYYITPDWTCDRDPQYQAQLFVDPKCKWGNCPIVSIAENEGCDENLPDQFNNGCYNSPATFTMVPDNQYVCGLSWRSADNWDEDAYKRHVQAGEMVNFSFQAEFPAVVYVYDVGMGVDCVYSQILAFHETDPCDIVSFDVSAASETDIAFIVFIRDVGNTYECIYGPWEYTFIINGESDCPEFTCAFGATVEGEGCEITQFQGYNAGCNSVPPTYAQIAYDETVCGTAWYGTAGFSLWRDTDWHGADIADGDSVVWCVTADFAFDAFIVDVSLDCDFDSNVTIVYDTGYACDTIYLTTVKQPDQNLKFIIAPRFFFPWLWCELGDWNWEATLTKVDGSCACDCAHDPDCSGVNDILDITQVVNVAFRFDPDILDPNPLCPWTTTDVDCSGFTDILDITRMVNVAFRFGDPAVEFCNPCPLVGGD